MSGATLPGFRIPRIDGLMVGKKVPGKYGNEVQWARDAAGATWVMKQEAGYQGLLAEIVSWLLGEHLQIRQPACALTCIDDEWSWLSAAIIPVTHWQPRYRDAILNRDELGRMLALDAIVCNEDRHPGNLLVELRPDENAVQVWAIDAGNALAAAEQARHLSHEHLRGWVVEGCAVVREDRVDPLTEALFRRCQAAPDLTLRYIDLLERHA